MLTSKNIIARPPKIVLQLFDVPVLDYCRSSDQRRHRRQQSCRFPWRRWRVLPHMSSVELTGDLERKFDLEISPLCDQQADSVPAIQTG